MTSVGLTLVPTIAVPVWIQLRTLTIGVAAHAVYWLPRGAKLQGRAGQLHNRRVANPYRTYDRQAAGSLLGFPPKLQLSRTC